MACSETARFVLTPDLVDSLSTPMDWHDPLHAYFLHSPRTRTAFMDLKATVTQAGWMLFTPGYCLWTCQA